MARQTSESRHNARLQIRVLGKPMSDQTVAYELTEAEGQPIHVRLLNSQEQIINEIIQPLATRYSTIGISRTAGVYLLVVETPTQRVATRVLKQVD